MKPVLLLLALLFPALAHGQSIGCFTSDGFSCSLGKISCGTDESSNLLLFGYTVADLCNQVSNAQASVSACTANYNALLASHDTNVNDYNVLLTYYQAQRSLIRRLRKKCGTKCAGVR